MDRLRKVFDFNSGVIAALLMGGIVGWINFSHGLVPASTAALKQGAYTFLMGGLIVRFCRALASMSGPGWLVFATATLLPSLVTIGATFFVHSLKGTPEPVASTIPVAVMSLPSFSGLAYHTRRNAAGLAEADAAAPPLRGAESP
jgi:hypothetical protein